MVISQPIDDRDYAFFGILARLKWINRWGLKYNVASENVMEHSFLVAVIAHAIAAIHNELESGPELDANLIAVQALFHDAEEALLSDAPTPVKYCSPEFTAIYKQLETEAEKSLLRALPDTLSRTYTPLVRSDEIDSLNKHIIKIADTIAALIKCRFELGQGNGEFGQARRDIESRLSTLRKGSPVAGAFAYFEKTFLPAFTSTLDEQVSR